MTPPGPKPLPAEIKRRRTTKGRKTDVVSKRPIPETVTIGGREVDTSPPADLPEYGREFWRRAVSLLVDAGVVGEVDFAALRIMAVQVARAELARHALNVEADDAEDRALDARVKTTRKALDSLVERIDRMAKANVDVDVAQLAAIGKLEVTLANLTEYRRLRRETRGMVALGSTGQIVEHPLVQTERAAASLVLRYFENFALTPASRTRLALAGLQGKSLRKDLEDELGPTKTRKGAAAADVDGEATEDVA